MTDALLALVAVLLITDIVYTRRFTRMMEQQHISIMEGLRAAALPQEEKEDDNAGPR